MWPLAVKGPLLVQRGSEMLLGPWLSYKKFNDESSWQQRVEPLFVQIPLSAQEQTARNTYDDCLSK